MWGFFLLISNNDYLGRNYRVLLSGPANLCPVWHLEISIGFVTDTLGHVKEGPQMCPSHSLVNALWVKNEWSIVNSEKKTLCVHTVIHCYTMTSHENSRMYCGRLSQSVIYDLSALRPYYHLLFWKLNCLQNILPSLKKKKKEKRPFVKGIETGKWASFEVGQVGFETLQGLGCPFQESTTVLITSYKVKEIHK